MDGQVEQKKSYWLIYTLVVVFYVAMIITYALVVHHAAESGANDVKCNPEAIKPEPCPPENQFTYAAKEYTGYQTTLLETIQDIIRQADFNVEQ